LAGHAEVYGREDLQALDRDGRAALHAGPVGPAVDPCQRRLDPPQRDPRAAAQRLDDLFLGGVVRRSRPQVGQLLDPEPALLQQRGPESGKVPVQVLPRTGLGGGLGWRRGTHTL
jgi:hypothetical protein